MGAAAYPMIGMLGSSLISSIFAPDGQELQTFEGEGNLDPRNIMGESRSSINDMIGLLKARADRPVELRSSYAQNLPVFTGGGLPMPIGIYGTDPALRDPSLLRSTPAMSLSGATSNGIIDRTNPPRGSGEDPIQIPNRDPNDPASGPYGASGSIMPMRRNVGQSLFSQPGGVAQGGGGDDLGQGAASVELLLRSML